MGVFLGGRGLVVPRSASAGILTILLTIVYIGAAQAEERCAFDPSRGRIVCHAHGDEAETSSPTARPGRNGEPPPRIYVHTATDPGVGDCYFVSATPGGLDITDPLDEPLIVNVVTTLPPCPGIAPVITPEEIQTRAWEIFRSFAYLDGDDPIGQGWYDRDDKILKLSKPFQ